MRPERGVKLTRAHPIEPGKSVTPARAERRFPGGRARPVQRRPPRRSREGETHAGQNDASTPIPPCVRDRAHDPQRDRASVRRIPRTALDPPGGPASAALRVRPLAHRAGPERRPGARAHPHRGPRTAESGVGTQARRRAGRPRSRVRYNGRFTRSPLPSARQSPRSGSRVQNRPCRRPRSRQFPLAHDARGA